MTLFNNLCHLYKCLVIVLTGLCCISPARSILILKIFLLTRKHIITNDGDERDCSTVRFPILCSGLICKFNRQFRTLMVVSQYFHSITMLKVWSLDSFRLDLHNHFIQSNSVCFNISIGIARWTQSELYGNLFWHSKINNKLPQRN